MSAATAVLADLARADEKRARLGRPLKTTDMGLTACPECGRRFYLGAGMTGHLYGHESRGDIQDHAEVYAAILAALQITVPARKA